LSNGAAFHLTRGWWLSGDIHYVASGTGGIHYNAIDFKEKNLIVQAGSSLLGHPGELQRPARVERSVFSFGPKNQYGHAGKKRRHR
jgi:hypothetical protein